MTHVTGKVTRPESRVRPIAVRFIVDSGAVYSVLPESVWRRLGLKRLRDAEFEVADGTIIARPVSRCTEISGISDTSPVVLGAERDAALLGMVTLEPLGLMLNPLTRELLPMRLLLAAARSTGPRSSTISTS
jgi:predicted aspartyl protease